MSRSLRMEGAYYPLGLDTVITGTETLSETLYAFVHGWDYDQADKRREHANMIAEAVLDKRVPIQRIYLPLVVKRRG